MRLSVSSKFCISLIISLGWMFLSIYLAQAWISDLSSYLTIYGSYFVIAMIAILPGFMNAFLLSSLLLDRRPARLPLETYPPLSILIAAFNEEKAIVDTLTSIKKTKYSGELEILVINDGSTDSTAEKVNLFCRENPEINIRLINQDKNAGKSEALNRGLRESSNELIVTIDGDSYLFGNALTRLVERLYSDPPETVAVAGSVLVRNPKESIITKAQEWDYFLGIAGIKRMQSFYHGTLVAQGAFSIYKREALERVGGWHNCVGEDIVLTWAMLKEGSRIGHCEDAVMFTNAPTTIKAFLKQRIRWSRGMIEAFKNHTGVLLKKRKSTFFHWWNLTFPLMDIVFTFIFIPGIIAALFGYYWIAGPLTLLVLPFTILVNMIIFRISWKMFDAQGLKVYRNWSGFFFYILVYSLILQPACVWGYIKELLNMKKSWGTK